MIFQTQLFQQGGFAEKTFPEGEAASGGTDDDMPDAVFPGKLQNGFHDVVALIGEYRRPDLTRQFKSVVQMALSRGVDLRCAFSGCLDVENIPVPVEASGEPGAVAQEGVCIRTA